MFALLLILAIAGMIYENIAEARDRRFNPMPGKLVAVAGSKMHIDCLGDAGLGITSPAITSPAITGPSVILESGLGDTYISWRKVQPQIAKFAHVCSYDRAGLGFSDPTSDAPTSRAIATRLHALLQAAAIAPPYILVGHSMGGYTIRLFATLYPTEVAGLVFVDASHPDQENRFPAEIKNMMATEIRESEFLAYTMPFGFPRLLGLCDPDPDIRAAECNFHHAREVVAELKTFSESAAQAAATGPFGDLPLAVLSHDPDKPLAELPPDVAQPVNQAWEKMQEDLSHLSTRGSQQIAKNSGHYIQLDRPELVIEAVRTVADQSRIVAAQSRAAQSPSK